MERRTTHKHNRIIPRIYETSQHIRYIGHFALALNLYFAIGSNFNDFKQGFEDGQKSSTYDTQADSHGFRAEIRVTPISTPSDSLNLQLPGKTVKAPYQVSEITCLIKETPTMLITIIFSALGVIVLSVYGVYSLIRVLICITRQDIFPAATSDGFAG